MKGKVVILALVICLVLAKNKAEWVHEIGLNTAMQFPYILMDGNYTNIVILEELNHVLDDPVVEIVTEIVLGATVTVRHISVR